MNQDLYEEKVPQTLLFVVILDCFVEKHYEVMCVDLTAQCDGLSDYAVLAAFPLHQMIPMCSVTAWKAGAATARVKSSIIQRRIQCPPTPYPAVAASSNSGNRAVSSSYAA